MRRRMVALPIHWMDMEIIFAILAWYLRQLQEPTLRRCTHHMVIVLLYWRSYHLVYRRASDEAWQQFPLTIHDACALDGALSCFVAAMHEYVPATATRRYALAYIGRLREYLRGQPLTPKKQTRGRAVCRSL